MAILGKVQRGQPITADLINNIIDGIQECRLQSVVGGYFRRGQGGTTVTVLPSRGGGEGLNYPFEYYSGGTAAAPWFGIRAGTINGIIQDNTSTTFSLQECYVNLECTTDGKQVQTAEVVIDEAPPEPVSTTPEVAPPSFKVSLYYIDDDLKAFRTIGASPIMAIPQEMIKESITGVGFGELPFRSWYSWVFAS